jgi:hypothetical protein
MKESFTQKLGDILFTDVMENSYYDDENTNEIETPDYDEAYRLLASTKSITKKDLDETYRDPQEGVKFTGLDLLKVAILGDFNNEYDYHSDMSLNLKGLEGICNALENDSSIWDKRHKKAKDNGMSDVDYKKYEVSRLSLAQVAHSRIASCVRNRDKAEIKLCQQLVKKLSIHKTFIHDEEMPYYQSLDKVYKEAPDKKSKDRILNQVKKVATFAVNGQVSKIIDAPETEPYSIKDCAYDLLVFGSSRDPFFDEVASQIKSMKEKVKSQVKKEESLDLG